ncbi:MAG: translation initiation factor IF-2 [Armatimonadota bacterium]
MAKIRIFALAKELGLESRKLLETLEGLGVKVRSLASSIDDTTATAVRELLADSVPKPAEPEPVGVAGEPEEQPVEAAVAVAEPEAEAEAPPEAEPAEAPVEPVVAAMQKRRERGPRPPRGVDIPPVVAVLGHIDHGKTTLLDALRDTDVTATEHGGITQHIGASEVTTDGRRIVFLDTPGHAAFTAMRARGAYVTDLVVLVVAADDGVMSQTREAIAHARAAQAPIIVAINKIDLPDANVDRAKQQLAERGLEPEDWGGDTVCVPVSALRGDGLPDLIEAIHLVAEMEELWGDPTAPLSGVVIESEMDASKGPIATVLVHDGTLAVGDALICGAAAGRVRAMTNWRGESLTETPPGTAVELIGLSDVPQAGDIVDGCENVRVARDMADERRQALRERELGEATRVRLENVFEQAQEGELKELNVIVKADTWGSAEALQQALEAVNAEYGEIQVKIIHAAVGPINESDITLAVASNAIAIGYHVEEDSAARRMAEREGVDVRIYRVIYDAIDDLHRALLGLLEPVFRDVLVGRAEVLQTFRASRVGQAAGCRVTEGRMVHDADLTVRRGELVVYEGKLASLRRFQEDVQEVDAGTDCGIAVVGFRGWREGDLIEARVTEQLSAEERRELARSSASS